MNIKVKDLKQTETIENSDKFMVLVDDDLNLVKNITKEELLTNFISSKENNALIQETDGNLYVNTSEISDSITALDTKFTNKIGDLNNLTTENKTNLVSAINEAAQSGASGSSLPLGAPVVMDRILSFEESKGLALQGTYVYKNAATGRYGYPNFYQKYLDEKNAGTPTQVTLGDSTITMYVNTNGLTFYDIADKAVIDNFFNTYGIADYYGVDTENERIFLPRNNYFLQLTSDTTKVNQFNKAGAPNITGASKAAHVDTSGDATGWEGCVKTEKVSSRAATQGGDGDSTRILIDASMSNPIYGNSDTIQPPSSNKLLYYVVGNTEQQTAITDVVDITTSENDTLPEFYNFYSDEDMTVTGAYVNASLGSWLSGTLYETSYNKLVNRIGQKFCKGYVKENTEDYTDYDCVINQTEQKFRLPLKNGDENLPDFSNGIDLGINTTTSVSTPSQGWLYVNSNDSINSGNDTKIQGSYNSDMTDAVNIYFSRWDQNVFTTSGTAWVLLPKDFYLKKLAGTKDIEVFYPAIGNGNLYFKLGNALQNQDIINVAEVLSALNLKADIDLSNINAAAQLTIANLACPDMGSGITLSNGSRSNPYNYPYPVMFYGTQANMGADSALYISTTKNGTTYVSVLGGNSGQGRRQSFSWLIPANYNFYIVNFGESAVFPLIGGNH